MQEIGPLANGESPALLELVHLRFGLENKPLISHHHSHFPAFFPEVPASVGASNIAAGAPSRELPSQI